MGNNSSGVQTTQPRLGQRTQDTAAKPVGALSGLTFGTHVILINSFTNSGLLSVSSTVSSWFDLEAVDVALTSPVQVDQSASQDLGNEFGEVL